MKSVMKNVMKSVVKKMEAINLMKTPVRAVIFIFTAAVLYFGTYSAPLVLPVLRFMSSASRRRFKSLTD